MNTWVKRAMIVAGAGFAASLAAKALLRQSRWINWPGKRVIVTGGSRGLGLCLARKLVSEGADVAICARSAAELEVAGRDLAELAHTSRVLAQVCDVRNRQHCESFVQEVCRQWGRVDVLINNAGIIEVGPLDSMTEEDFQQSMDTHCWGALNMVQACLPTMRQQEAGRIVNVASLGGKRAVPHMLPYAASKFALVGLSNGLRTELAKENILVTTVCPGLMRTGSPRNAIFKSQHRKEYAWFSIGDSMPLFSINADSAADQILLACQNGDPEAVIAGPFNFTSFLAALAPGWTTELLSLMDRGLPEMGGIGQRAARGYESFSSWSPSWLTRLSDQAAARNNELLPSMQDADRNVLPKQPR